MMTRTMLLVLLSTACSISAFSQAPKITSFTSATGPANTSITIVGTGFSATAANNIVYFGAVRGTVTAASITQLTVNVPAGASFEPLSVTANGRIGYASKPFVVTYPGNLPLSQNSFKPYVNFSYASEFIDAADLDNDGKADLLYADGTISAVRNNLTGGSLTRDIFKDPVALTTDVNVSKTLLADFDGDGYKDLLQASGSTAELWVYRNLATAMISTTSFTSAIKLGLPLNAADFSIADVDGDGRLDIVTSTTDFSNFYLTLLQNTSTPGNISFAAHVDIPITGGITTVGTGDLNGDGFPEVLAMNYNRLLTLFENKMTGPGALTTSSFATPFDIYSNDYPTDFMVADMDQDGRNDIVLTSQSLVLHHRNATAGALSLSSFDTPAVFNVSGKLAIGDLNGDSKPDLALAGYGYDYINVFTNTSIPGSLTTSSLSNPLTLLTGVSYYGLEPSQVRINDLDNDGKSEVIILNSRVPNISILKNMSGTPPAVPTIESFAPASGSSGTTVTIQGTNFSTTPADNIVFLGAAKAVVTSASATSLVVTVPVGATADFITVTAHTRTAFSKIPFTPTPSSISDDDISFAEPIELATDANPDHVMIKDLDDDGRPEVLGRTYVDGFVGVVNIFKNISEDLDAEFDVLFATTAVGADYTVVDADGDGIPDLLGSKEDGGDGAELHVVFGTGTISDYEANPLILPAGSPTPGNFAIADLDGDGQPDFGLTDRNYYGVETYRNANGGFPSESLQNLNLNPESSFIIFADIDGDRKPDAITVQPDNGTIEIAQNNSTPGATSFSAPIGFNTDSGPAMVAAADLDGDGKIDLVTANGNSVSVLRNTMQGPGVITSAAFGSHVELGAVTPKWVAVGDLNGDGKPDLGVANGNNTISIFKNGSTAGALSGSSFISNTPVATGKNPSGIAFGDLNADGATDMAVTIADENLIAVYISIPGQPTESKLIVYNGVSPNGDGKNDHWHIQNINVLADTKVNHVAIFNRWGDRVYETDNYDNTTSVFTGKSSSGKELPSGTYYYKINFTGGRKMQSGFISLKR